VEDAPGTRFEYSTGNSMLLMRTVMEQRGDPQWTHFEYPRQKLFRPLSMVSALIEPQANGVPAGGSLAYMKAQDWARIGLLFLRDGVWVDGTRIFPEGWVAYSFTAAPTSVFYGAQIWLHYDLPGRGAYMSGFRQQNVSIFPGKDLVVARFSMPKLTGGGFDLNAFLRPILDAFPDVDGA
jgi:CubicO group peptidase (beta-lactamase class C family)